MSTTADVIKFEKTPDGSIYYFIKVFYNGKEWGLRKRYSDFLKLDEFLRKDGVNVSYALPPKRFWKRFDKSTLLERQKGLQSYLAMLLKSTASDDNLVKEFLDVDHNRLVLLKKTSIHAFKLAVRLETRALILAQHMIPIPIKNSLQARARAVSPLSPTSPFTPLSLKTKSLSFSRGFSFSTRASSRRGSFAQGPGGQGDAFAYERKISRDRSFTTVTFKTSNVDLVTLKELLKKEAYVEAVSAVWSKYDTEMKDAMGMVRDCMPVSCWESPMALDLLALGGDHMTDRDEGAGSLLMEGHHELILEAMSLPVCSFDECLSASSTSRPSHISRPSWYTSLSNDYTRPSNASRPSYTFRPSYEYTTRPSTTSQASGTSRNSLSPAVSALRESEDEGTGEGVVTEGTGGTEGTEGEDEEEGEEKGDERKVKEGNVGAEGKEGAEGTEAEGKERAKGTEGFLEGLGFEAALDLLMQASSVGGGDGDGMIAAWDACTQAHKDANTQGAGADAEADSGRDRYSPRRHRHGHAQRAGHARGGGIADWSVHALEAKYALVVHLPEHS